MTSQPIPPTPASPSGPLITPATSTTAPIPQPTEPGTGTDTGTQNPLTVRGIQQFIRDKYFATDSVRGTPATFMWFIEEVGELSTAMANNAPGKTASAEERANLEEEFADVLAWLCTLANINGVELERALEKYTVRGVEGVKD